MIRFELSTSYRYRGYRYDTETGFYYLQSRYYDPEIGRFINADSYVDTGDTVLSTNMFAYCENNAVNGYDPSGEYNRNKALSYAYKWHNKYNPQYYKYSKGDCANFVSQCLYAGGFSMNKTWHSYRLKKKIKLPGQSKYFYNWDVTTTWNQANKLYQYFRKNSQVKKEVTLYKRDQLILSKIISKYGIKKGDLMFFSHKGKNVANHATMISYVSQSCIYYTAHTEARWNYSLWNFFDEEPNGVVYILLFR